MTQRQLLSLLALALIAMPSFAELQVGDVQASEDGNIVYIDGAKGARLHLEYTGEKRSKPLKVRVTADDTGLKLSGAICYLVKPGDVCSPTLHLTNPRKKVYGVHKFTVTEVGGLSAPVAAKPVIFGVGLKEKGAPTPVVWESGLSDAYYSSPIILVNATQSDRLYSEGEFVGRNQRNDQYEHNIKPYKIKLPSYRICYIDKDSIDTESRDRQIIYRDNNSERILIKDMTDPSNPINNSPKTTGNENITACSADAHKRCASGLWASMSVGLANLGADNLKATSYWADPWDDIAAGEVKVVYDQTWDAAGHNQGAIIYFETAWAGPTMALLQIQGSTDGSAFDVKRAAPTALAIKSAAPCSSFIQK